MVVTAVSRPRAPREKATVQEVRPCVVDRALEAEQAVQDVCDAVGQARVADHAVLGWTLTMMSPRTREPAPMRTKLASARQRLRGSGRAANSLAVAQQGREQRERR